MVKARTLVACFGNRRKRERKKKTFLTYTVGNNEKQSIDKDGPDENVAKDSGHQGLRMWHHDGAIPVNGHKGPCQRARSNRHMDEARGGIVAEVQRAEIRKVENQDDLCNGKVLRYKEQDEDDVQQVVEDEVAANAGCGMDDVGVAGEEGGGISELENEEHNPISFALVLSCL